MSLLLNTYHVKSVPCINKPVYCLKRADFDKMKCLLIDGGGGGGGIMILNTKMSIIHLKITTISKH